MMGDRPGSLKLGSLKLLDVGGREPGLLVSTLLVVELDFGITVTGHQDNTTEQTVESGWHYSY